MLPAGTTPPDHGARGKRLQITQLQRFGELEPRGFRSRWAAQFQNGYLSCD